MSLLLPQLLAFADSLLTGFSIGVTVWFFFFQSPFLFQRLGKEKFVPIMMQMTKLWVRTIFYACTALLAVATLQPQALLYPILAWFAIAINHSIVVPNALKAGARSHAARKGDHTKNVQEFVLEGGGKSETKTLHQTVVAFVLLQTGSLLVHLFQLTSGTMH
jgi:hypothetical protein